MDFILGGDRGQKSVPVEASNRRSDDIRVVNMHACTDAMTLYIGPGMSDVAPIGSVTHREEGE